ncbi:hypothetical protein KKC04_03080 [Patescibacteria group bacterium]|nr:hypothetical protein [Patescibacteria group bacterium]
MSKNYFHAIATMVGTIIGVGIFVIPYVISKSGIILLFVYLPLLGIVQYFLHKLYAEIILSTEERHRLPGYVEKYFGGRGKKITLALVLIGSYGGLLAYIIVGGIFLQQLLSPYFGGNVFFYSTTLFILEAAVVLMGMKLIASVELIMSGLLLLMVALIAWRGWGYINLDNYSLINWSNVFLPYGPIFFAVGGEAAIPSVCRLLARQKKNIKSAICWGTFIPVAVMLFFTVLAVGITGNNTTPDTLAGLNSVIGNGAVIFALLFGLLAIITSFLTLAQAVKEVYWWDLGMNKKLAWCLSCVVPYFLYLIGFQNLIKIISLTGAVTGGILGVVVICLIFKVKKKKEHAPIISNNLSKPFAYFLSLLFILGLIYEIWMVAK